MTPGARQLELNLDASEPVAGAERSPGGVLARGTGSVLQWAPLWVPLLILAQLSMGGLRPALAEARRLDEAERAVYERVDALRAERALLDEDGERLDDPIYRERVRRSLLVPGGAPLTLEKARSKIAEAAQLEALARGPFRSDSDSGATEHP